MGNMDAMLTHLEALLKVGKKNPKDFIDNLILPYQGEPKISQEAIYQSASALLNSGHYYTAYQILQQRNKQWDIYKSVEISELLIDILSDEKKACLSMKLKLNNREGTNLQFLPPERCQVLLEIIPSLALKEGGYYRWRDFLKCQSDAVWHQQFAKKLEQNLSDYSRIDWELMLDSSQLLRLNGLREHEELTCKTAIGLLRMPEFLETLPSGEWNGSGSFADGVRTLVELKASPEERLWIYYYLAKNALFFGESAQIAISYALSLQKFASACTGAARKLGIGLFLLSWADIQYWLGNRAEGIACCISSLSMLPDMAVFMEDAVRILAKYLGEEGNKSKKITGAGLEFLRSVSHWNRTADSVLALFDADDENTRKYQEKAEQAEQNSDWVKNVTNYAQILLHQGNGSRAARVILEHLPKLKATAIRSSGSERLLYEWAQILVWGEPTLENLRSALELLEQSLTQAETRRGAFHQDERAAGSRFLNKLLDECLFVCGLLYNLRETSSEERGDLDVIILRCASLLVPASVIEQKDYYQRQPSQRDEKDLQRLKALEARYYQMTAEARPLEERQKLAEELQLIQEEAIRNNPFIKPLEPFRGTDWKAVQESLSDEDILYQPIIVKNLIFSVLCAKTEIQIVVRISDVKTLPEQCLKQYAHMVEQGASDSIFEKNSETVTELLAAPLMDYLKAHSVRHLYVIPEMRLNVFPFAAGRKNGVHLLDKVREIAYMVDYRAISRYLSSSTPFYPVFNRLYGKMNDSSIHRLKQWLEQEQQRKANFSLRWESEGENKPLSELEEAQKAETVCLYGHGVSDPQAGEMDGALYMEGASQMLELSHLLDGLTKKRLIILSCLSGATNEATPELAKGVWKGVFERYSGEILLCKWSVPTQGSINLLKRLYQLMEDEAISLGEALVLAQREMKEHSPLHWAGIEFWIH